MWKLLVLLSALMIEPVSARVDTLFGTVEVEDATIYGYPGCDGEKTGEECRRYNAGNVLKLEVGISEVGDSRAVMRFPGWDGTLPDSSVLDLYCTAEEDSDDRRIFIYPLTRRFFEGEEMGSGSGDYPDPDSGVTWYHAWLDVGNGDSLNWTTAGGDFTTATACTLLVTGAGTVHRAKGLNRILSWWRDHATDPGLVLVNQNAFPANGSRKTFAPTESGATGPRLILYYPDDEPADWTGRRLRVQALQRLWQ